MTSRWRRFFGVKENPVARYIIDGTWGNNTVVTPKTNLKAQAEEGYQSNVTVFCCVNIIARGCAGIPWVLMQRGKGKDTKPQKLMTLATASKAWNGNAHTKAAVRAAEIENHPLLQLLERPNPGQGGPEYLEAVMGFLLIAGNSFETWVSPETGPNKGRPMELWSLRPDRMKIKTPAMGIQQLVGTYEYWVGTDVASFDPSLILHQKFFSPLDDFWGLSPIQVASRVIDGDNAAQKWNAKLMENEARPSAALVIKNGLQEDARERLRDQLNKRMSGADNARKPMILEGDTDWKILSHSPAELDWLEGRKRNQHEIGQAYGVPPALLGDVDTESYASKKQARLQLYMETILPLMDRRRDNFNNAVTPLFGDGLYLDYDKDQIEALREDSQQLYLTMRFANWLTENEKREATGYDTYAGNPETDKPEDVPFDLLRLVLSPGTVPGQHDPSSATPRGAPGMSEPGMGTPSDPNSENAPNLKAQTLSVDQKAHEQALEKKLNAHFKKQSKALAAHLKRHVG